MVTRKHDVQIFVHHIRISTMNVSSVMLGIETVFGKSCNLLQFKIESCILKSRNRINGLYKPEGKYNTSPNEININK